MKVILAESAGFCYGVERAVALAHKTAEENGGCRMLGDLIHNAHVVDSLERKGIRKISGIGELRPGDTVLIRSHGELKCVLKELENRDIRCVNATCPNVMRIQRLVAEADEQGRHPLIIGEAKHPEVMGIASWCRDPLIFSAPADLHEWLEERPENRHLPLTVVAQTTCIRELFETSSKIIKKECTNAKIFDTICNATHKRQSEAAKIAASVDVMVVVGDRKSANTKHLTEICSESCPRVFQIESADELSPDWFNGCCTAGLLTGSSEVTGVEEFRQYH